MMCITLSITPFNSSLSPQSVKMRLIFSNNNESSQPFDWNRRQILPSIHLSIKMYQIDIHLTCISVVGVVPPLSVIPAVAVLVSQGVVLGKFFHYTIVLSLKIGMFYLSRF